MSKRIDRTGETNTANNGQTMTIVEYINANHIVVEFDDEQKTRVKTRYIFFKYGTVRNPNFKITSLNNLYNERLGETSKANNGQTMTIVKYINNQTVIIEFDDGTRVKTTYSCFKNGKVRNQNYMPHIGETNTATNGQTMTIVKYINYDNIIVEFDDGTRVKTHYGCFEKGEVKNPNYLPHIGETSKATNGQTMTIVEYINNKNIIVEFDDGTRVKTSYRSFKKGITKNPNYMPHIGETNTATNGQTMTIVKYINYDKIIVELDDGTRVKTTYSSFKKGAIKNPNHHIGETNTATNGQTMTIMEYGGCYNIIVEFDDGTRVKTTYSCFKRGTVKNPNYHIGETSKATNGQTMTIVKYINNQTVIIEFDDGTRVKTTYSCFKNGKVRNPNYMPHIGETNTATNGQTMTIVKYINYRNIIVEFDDGTRVKTAYDGFKKSEVKNPHFPMSGKGTYKTFQTQYAYTAPDSKVYFYCECQKCGFKANLTAKEVIGLNHGCWNTRDGEK